MSINHNTKNILRQCRLKLRKILGLAPNIKPQIVLETERHGSEYGGWTIKKNSISENSIIYSFGIGNDISFDTSLIDKYGVEIYAFDPTPQVKDWLNKQNLPSKFKYYELALADRNGVLRFYLPENPEYISHSIIKKNINYIEVSCKKLSSIMDQFQHKRIDILKIDIEGAEFISLKDILLDKLEVSQVLVEFHHFFEGISKSDTENIVLEMNKAGYKIFYISPNGYEYSFIR